MKNKKIEFYTLDAILKTCSQYMVLFGERSNGKSYAVKKRCIERAWTHKEKFVYMRRWREDLVNNRAESYFDDMEEDDLGNRNIVTITQGEYDCISVYRGDIYLAVRDKDGKKCRGLQIGRTVALTADTHEKSRSYVGYYRIVYEEMITTSGYVPNEVKIFMSLVSTILRRRWGEVFLIGNTLTRQCPFFREWELVNVPRQRLGSIDVYAYKTGEYDDANNEIIIKIACEYCANANISTKMVFGNNMITKGEWQTVEKPHLPRLYGDYKRKLSILIRDELELFCLDVLSFERVPFLYVRLIDKKWTDDDKYDIIITNEFLEDIKYVSNLRAIPSVFTFVSRLFQAGKICYEDNLVATSFLQLVQNRKII